MYLINSVPINGAPQATVAQELLHIGHQSGGGHGKPKLTEIIHVELSPQGHGGARHGTPNLAVVLSAPSITPSSQHGAPGLVHALKVSSQGPLGRHGVPINGMGLFVKGHLVTKHGAPLAHSFWEGQSMGHSSTLHGTPNVQSMVLHVVGQTSSIRHGKPAVIREHTC
ncbi:hypothetical protein [Comamonas sp. NoAH]|uniref:hypothetical protein n=1 Tax=Comamonas halotolerans TaxID=3041496 RepID=UPI0024E101C2|nr:hypothetical protein [Comamonas sp. NoAH]